jgi:hypothetical protein
MLCILQIFDYRKSFDPHQLILPMIRLFFVALSLAHSLLPSSAVAATPFYKCNANGSVHYQQGPCQSNEARKPPTVEELNAERQKQLAQEREKPTGPKFQAHPQASASPEAIDTEPAKFPSSPRSSFTCDSRKYCTQMTSCAEAKYFLSNCPSVKMDGDRDGIPCEDQLCRH